MDKWMIFLMAALVGYLIGSISFSRILFAIKRPGVTPDPIRTPTTDGKAELISRSVGATNVMIAFGPRWGMFVSLIDILKTFIPTLVFLLLFPEEKYSLVCATAVLAGHLWPVWHSFKGGGGNSSVIGMLLAISPVGLVVTHVCGMIVGKFLPVFGFLGGVLFMIPWFAIRNGIFSPETLFAIIICLLYVVGQLPEGIQILRLKREGHELDMRYVMNMMKRSAATGKAGSEVTGNAVNNMEKQSNHIENTMDE